MVDPTFFFPKVKSEASQRKHLTALIYKTFDGKGFNHFEGNR